jgi:two-component system response regulator
MPNGFVVLLVEDDHDDQMLMRMALSNSVHPVQLQVVDTGTRAWDYLRGRGSFAAPGAAPRPDLILLDLNLPGMDGHELLRRIREDANLRTIPVVVISTSSRKSDVLASYAKGANSYITKPSDYDEYGRVMQHLQSYWLKLVVLPGAPAGGLPGGTRS